MNHPLKYNSQFGQLGQSVSSWHQVFHKTLYGL